MGLDLKKKKKKKKYEGVVHWGDASALGRGAGPTQRDLIFESDYNGFPQDSFLDPVLFIIYINDVNAGLANFITNFADDRKIGYSVLYKQGRERLRKELYKISAWSDK